MVSTVREQRARHPVALQCSTLTRDIIAINLPTFNNRYACRVVSTPCWRVKNPEGIWWKIRLIDQLCVRRAILPTSKMFRIDGGDRRSTEERWSLPWKMVMGWVSIVECSLGSQFEVTERKGNERCEIIFSPQAAGRRPLPQSHGDWPTYVTPKFLQCIGYFKRTERVPSL